MQSNFLAGGKVLECWARSNTRSNWLRVLLEHAALLT